jgi:hypothetical protein
MEGGGGEYVGKRHTAIVAISPKGNPIIPSGEYQRQTQRIRPHTRKNKLVGKDKTLHLKYY